MATSNAPSDEDISFSNKEVMKSNFIDFAKNTLGVTVEKSDIVDIYPVAKRGQQASGDNTRVIFNSIEKKADVYGQRRILFQNHKGIFLNEDLTTRNFEILMEARKLKKDGKLEFVWSKNGVIHCKTFADNRVPAKTLTIRRKGDLNQVR